jgi:hypothetical protein
MSIDRIDVVLSSASGFWSFEFRGRADRVLFRLRVYRRFVGVYFSFCFGWLCAFVLALPGFFVWRSRFS